ncbi:Bromodomain-containing protein 7 [Bagarius yarrelli]|uniref:Bromodomain-containing protein 7 n=1 Tax=Bagarius yarrelli TaxID=175774 RepID=A0A556V3I2_BAGYA|nr:Bromodomain-containing protein 7 [Bagarius yarrelli]
MGKKHKKHKSEKHTYDEYADRPLKLVLKVAGNEVTTGSASLEPVPDDQIDSDKHKDKKKKKKKKDEKDKESPPGSPGEVKRKSTFLILILIVELYSFTTKLFFLLLLFQTDFRIMCENAMIYNKPDTIYYRAAKKLLHSGMKILNPERIASLKQSIEFMADLKPGSEGREEHGSSTDSKDRSSPMDTGAQSPRVTHRDTSSKESKEEAQRSATQAEKDLEEVKKLIEESGGKLSSRSLQCELDFGRRKADGTTTLGIANPADLSAGVMYMNYGPYTSYAPTYDSSFANISKEDSDLIYSIYSEESSLQGSDSMAGFLAKSEEHMSRLADNILDALTNGEHSRQLKETETVVGSEIKTANSMSVLNSVMGLGLDLLQESFDSQEAEQFQKKLDETTVLLRDLHETQRERLSAKQPPNMICLLAPTAKELQLAEKVTENLAQLTSRVTPGDVSSLYGIRKAMGISLPSEPAEGTFTHLTTVGAEQVDGVCTGPDDVASLTL